MSILYFDVLATEANLRDFLSKRKEFDDFDNYVITYVEDCIGHRIIRRPAKGRYGEDGKDFVAIENETELSYCSYIIKAGNLDKNLDGEYGIIISLEKAMFTELKEDQYKGKLRTAIVVYNGNDGGRSAPDRFDIAKAKIEDRALKEGILYRKIERWDLSFFSKKLYGYNKYLREKEYFQKSINMMTESVKIIDSIKKNFPAFDIDEKNPKTPEAEYLVKLNKNITSIEDKYGTIQIIKSK